MHAESMHALSGRDLAYGAMPHYVLSDTDLAYAATARFALSGTDSVYGVPRQHVTEICRDDMLKLCAWGGTPLSAYARAR
eukprot:1949855-Rhodomonas_salina.5